MQRLIPWGVILLLVTACGNQRSRSPGSAWDLTEGDASTRDAPAWNEGPLYLKEYMQTPLPTHPLPVCKPAGVGARFRIHIRISLSSRSRNSPRVSPLHTTTDWWRENEYLWISPGGPFAENETYYFQCGRNDVRTWDAGEYFFQCSNIHMELWVKSTGEGSTVPPPHFRDMTNENPYPLTFQVIAASGDEISVTYSVGWGATRDREHELWYCAIGYPRFEEANRNG